jgi:anti-sigma-K factor RskA
MNHEQAWTRLPDLLDDRDDPALLAHVRACADCQRQLFLLGRVDRLLRERARAVRSPRRPSRWRARRTVVLVTATAAAVAVAITLVVSGQSRSHELMFRTASGRAVGHAVMGHSDARNLSLALSAQGLPIDHGQTFVLWAHDTAGAPIQVGHFMVDGRGACRVRFNLPATQSWRQFSITRPGKPGAIIAST